MAGNAVAMKKNRFVRKTPLIFGQPSYSTQLQRHLLFSAHVKLFDSTKNISDLLGDKVSLFILSKYHTVRLNWFKDKTVSFAKQA